MYSRIAIGLAAFGVDLADLGGAGGILMALLGGRPGSPGVVTALGYSEHSAQHRYQVAGPLHMMSLKELTDPRSLPWRRRPR